MSIDIARSIVEACKRRAEELRSPVSIAVVDAGGHLVLFERMMAPYGWATSDISIAKAATAVMFNQPTDMVAQWGASIPGFASSMATMSGGKFIMAAGGWPIYLDGATIGGIGVSGGNAPGRDDDIARAGLAIIEAPAHTATQGGSAQERAMPAQSFPQRGPQPMPENSFSSSQTQPNTNTQPNTRHLLPASEEDASAPASFDPYKQHIQDRSGGHS